MYEGGFTMFTTQTRNYLALLLAISFLFISSGVMAEGLRKVVAVKDFEQKFSGSGVTSSNSKIDLGRGMSEQLTNALVKSGQFIVLERQKLSSVIEEQDMAASGRFQKSKSAQTGKLTSAQVLIEGVITEFESSSGTGGAGISFGGISLGSKTNDIHIGLIIRLIDTTSGQVIDSQRVEGKISTSDVDFGLSKNGINFGSDSFNATPVGKVVQETINKSVKYIASRMKNIPFKGKVIKANGKTLFISAGTRNGAKNGDSFGVYSTGESLIDPDTGENLGSDEVQIGIVKIFQANEKFSKAKAAGNIMGVKAGDAVKQLN
jgi:curli biogenesis system outer membrane secretion channel CsgG